MRLEPEAGEAEVEAAVGELEVGDPARCEVRRDVHVRVERTADQFTRAIRGHWMVSGHRDRTLTGLSTILLVLSRDVSEPDAYSALHTAIVTGEISPGERLIEEELAERLGLSRGAVRAAILRLDHEGLVVRERNRGARVRRFTPAEAVEILEARAALESLAAGYAALRRNDDDIRELRGLVADMARLLDHGELLSISERNAVLHRRILEISGHTVARDICSRLHSQMVRYQFRTVLAPGRAAAVARGAHPDRVRDRRRRPQRRRAGDARPPDERRVRAR